MLLVLLSVRSLRPEMNSYLKTLPAEECGCLPVCADRIARLWEREMVGGCAGTEEQSAAAFVVISLSGGRAVRAPRPVTSPLLFLGYQAGYVQGQHVKGATLSERFSA